MNKKRLSLKYIILVPVIILGIVSVVSNIGSMNSLKRVNDTATKIVEENLYNIVFTHNGIFVSMLLVYHD